MKPYHVSRKPSFIKITLVFLVLTIPSVLYLLNINNSRHNGDFFASQGVLDLRDWDMDRNLWLDGQWEFYPKEIIRPGDGFSEKSKLITVPGSWESFMDNSSEGFATYRLLVKLPKDATYALKIKTLRLASEIYINGDLLSKTGQVSENRGSFSPASYYQFIPVKSVDGMIEIIIPVSSFGYHSGGIVSSIEFGEYNKMLRNNYRFRSLEVFSITLYYGFGLFFIMNYFRMGRYDYLLYFGLSFTSLAFFHSIMNEQLLRLLFDYSFYTRIRLQTVFMALSAIFLLKASHSFFKDYSNEKVVRLIAGINLFSLLYIFVNPLMLTSINAFILQVSLALSYLLNYSYVLLLLLRALKEKNEYSEYLWIIILSYVYYWLILIAKAILEIDTGSIQLILLAFMSIGVGLLIHHQQAVERSTLEELTNKLILESKTKNSFLRSTSEKLRDLLGNQEIIITQLYEGKKGSLNTRQQEDLLHLNREIQSLKRLSDDLVEATLLDKKIRKLTSSNLDVYRLVENILDQLNMWASDRNIQLINGLEPDFPILITDDEKFAQIIFNLLYNAIDNTGRNGIVRITANQIGDYVEFSIADSGAGIEESELSDIFNLFYKTQEDEDGLGIGLAVVKSLVEVQGGSIRVESKLGEGSIFTFSLPATFDTSKGVRTYEPEVPRLEVPVRESESARRVLITNRREADNYRLLFEGRDYRLFFEDEVSSVLQVLKEEAFDLLVVDFTKDSRGLSKLSSNIREEFSLVELPILAIMDYGARIDFHRAIDHGINDYIRKPLDREEFISRVESLIRMKASVEEGIEREFRYFRSQISPHFLYNTLNTIIMLSYKDEGKTREALYNLSIYFRGKLDIYKKGLISLSEEIELVKAYLEIEKLRFADKIDIVYELDDDLRTRIAPLTIQPLVENALKHGLKGRQDIQVIIRALKEDGFYRIEIIDNGAGIEESELRNLLEERSEGLGFVNSMRKIKMIKGSRLDVESILGQGTRITIMLPEVRNWK